MVDAGPAAPTAPAAVGPVNTNGQPISQAGGSIVPAGNPNVAMQTPGTMGAGQALLVTSGAARTATANNVSKLQSITTPPPTTPSTVTPAGSGQPNNININAGYAPGTTDAPNPALAGQSGYDAFGKAISATPTDTSNSTGGSGSSADPYDAAVASISDPGIAAQFRSSLQALDTQISQAQTNLQSAQALAQNDPAATAAISAIQAKYDQQIQLMKDKNTQLLGRASTSVAAFGGLGTMSQDFLNNEQQQADERIGALVSQEQDAVTKARIAYQTGDMKALNTAMTAYDTANKSKLTALNDLLTASSKQVTQMQAQQKIDAAATKQQVTLDISKSANLGAAIAKNIADSGLTDPQQVSDYIASVAQEYGITNPDILTSAVTKAQQAATKATDAHANTVSTINKRNQPKTPAAAKPGKDGSFTYTAADVSAYSDLLNKGGTGPDGTQYGARGATDQFVDPGAYVAALGDWVKNGGTPVGFAKKFPVKGNINPASYSLLPEAVRPTAAATPQYQTTN